MNVLPIRKEHAWEYSTNWVQSLLLQDVSNLIVDTFKDKVDPLIDYISINSLNVKIDIVIEILDDQVPALTFDRKFLDIANRLNSEIDVEMYLYNGNG